MARFRLSAPLQADLQAILATSQERWSKEGRVRYAALLSAAMRTIAENPIGATTRPRDEVVAALRSFHIRHARRGHGVRTPVHVVFYRVLDPDVIEIVRVLHERMDPARHFDDLPDPPRSPRRR